MYTETKKDWYVALVIFAIVMAAYVETMALAAPFWDSGEFIATSYILGIPHPPGTPLYVLIGRIFCLFPFANVATRVNFLSALSSVLAVLFTFLITVRIAKMSFKVQGWKAWLAGIVTSFFMAFSNTFWGNGTEAEVYSLSSFVMVLTLWMSLRWWDSVGKGHSDRMLLAIAYILSLSVGIHLGTLLVAPGILILVLLVDWRTITKSKLITTACALFVLGVSVHLYLLLRSRLYPAINEDDPTTWHDLWLVLKRDQYKPGSIFVRRADFSFQWAMFWGYFSNQFTMWGGKLEGLGRYLPILLGAVGAYFHAAANKKSFVALLTVILICSLGLIIYLNFTDHEVRERDYFYVASYHFFAIWMGIGATGLLVKLLKATKEYLKNPTLVVAAFSCLFVLASVLPYFHFHFYHDRSKDRIARNFAYNMLAPLEKNAIILTNGDNDTFPLWYIQEVEGIRKDVRVANLSLLRTPWYVRQLKYFEPRVPMTLTDNQIDGLIPYRDSTGKVWQTNEIVVHDMIRANNWQKPIYLAVTVPDQMGLGKQLVLEGLVFRVTPEVYGLRLDEAKMKRDLYEVFNWDGIFKPDGTRDDSFYKDVNESKLVQNYAAAYFTLAFWYRQTGRADLAVKEMERAYEVSPIFIDAARWLGQFYLENGQADKAEKHYMGLINQYPADAEMRYRLGRVHFVMGRMDEAIQDYRRAIELDPAFRDAYLALHDVYVKLGRLAESNAVLKAWLQIQPGDQEIRNYLEMHGGSQ
jgi:DNA-binding SARP family transcriptional activator